MNDDSFSDVDWGENVTHILPRYVDLVAYHKSITDEISSLKNRIRHLIGNQHWQTDGEHKETVLRKILRDRLPETVMIGKGFVITESQASNQIDILIVDSHSPTLFKDGDLMIVTPDAVRGVIEVKTRIRGPQEIQKAIDKLATVDSLVNGQSRSRSCWTGLFIYEDEPDHEVILQAIGRARREKNGTINCVSWGDSTFVRFWPQGLLVNSVCDGEVWHSYCLQNLAQAYFIGNAVDAISGQITLESESIWFPIEGGKEKYRRYYVAADGSEPRRFR